MYETRDGAVFLRVLQKHGLEAIAAGGQTYLIWTDPKDKLPSSSSTKRIKVEDVLTGGIPGTDILGW